MDSVLKNFIKNNGNIGTLTKLLISYPEFGLNAADASRYVAKLIDEVYTVPENEQLMDEDERYPTKINSFYKMEVVGGKERLSPDYHGLSKYFIQELKLRTNDSGSYLYNGKFYDSVSSLSLKKEILILTKIHEPNPNILKSFYEIVKIDSFDKIDKSSTDGFLNLYNGVLNISDKSLLPHSSKYFFRYCLPQTFDQNAKCPIFDEFLKTIFNGDEERINLAIEIIAYCLMGGRPFLEKAFVLVGTGANGKSTYINVIRKLIGHDNCSAIPMSKIDDERAVCMLDGKLVNLVEESPGDEISSEAFKNIISGGRVYARDVYASGYHFENRARLIFASNKLPYFKDTSYGNLRKLCFLHFDKTFDETEMDRFIENKLEGELSGILNRAINKIGLKEFTNPKNSMALTEEYKLDSDIVYRFYQEMVEYNIGLGTSFPAIEVYEKFKKWCEENGSKSSFGNRAFYKKFDEIMHRYSGIQKEGVQGSNIKIINKQKHYINIMLRINSNIGVYKDVCH